MKRKAFVFSKGLMQIAWVPFLLSCSLFATRPVQEMSDTDSAIKAAREVQADSLAPDLYREANEWFFKARKEFKLKNFSLAKAHAERARKLAEQAEFEAVRNGGARKDISPKAPVLDANPPAQGSGDVEPGFQETAPPENPIMEPIPTPKA